jgi:hypothetical protein
VLLYSLSPLTLFYDRALLPDNLAILLSLGSLWFFLWWGQSARPPLFAYAGMLGTGVAATLVKNPIYLPVCIAMVTWLCANDRARRLRSAFFLCFVAAVAMAVVTLKAYANYVNVGSLSTPAWEYEWYFSTLADRLRPEPYEILAERLLKLVVSPPVFGLAIIGACVFLFEEWTRSQKAIAGGLAVGALVTVGVFFNVSYVHDYYQLPYVFTMSVFAACASERCLGRVWRMSARSPRLLTTGLRAMCLGLALGALVYGTRFWMIPRTEAHALIAAGEFIRANTPAGAFVVYVIPRHDWNPEHLYFAKREGYNLGLDRLSDDSLRRVVETYRASYGQLYLFVPGDLAGGVERAMEALPEKASASAAGILFNL